MYSLHCTTICISYVYHRQTIFHSWIEKLKGTGGVLVVWGLTSPLQHSTIRYPDKISNPKKFNQPLFYRKITWLVWTRQSPYISLAFKSERTLYSLGLKASLTGRTSHRYSGKKHALKGIAHPKMKIIIIYSPSRWSKPVLSLLLRYLVKQTVAGGVNYIILFN